MARRGRGRRTEKGKWEEKKMVFWEVGRCGVVGSRAGLPGRKWGGRGMGLLTDGRGRLGRGKGKPGSPLRVGGRASRWWELWVVSWGWGQSVLYDSGTPDRADHGSYCESAGSGSTRKVCLSPPILKCYIHFTPRQPSVEVSDTLCRCLIACDLQVPPIVSVHTRPQVPRQKTEQGPRRSTLSPRSSFKHSISLSLISSPTRVTQTTSWQ